MNGPLKMYGLKPIIRHDVPIELPKCMYKMKNILSRSNDANDHSDHVSSAAKNLDISEQVKKFLKANEMHPDMAALQARQQKILAQLSELKEQILSLKTSLTSTNEMINVPVPTNETSDNSSKFNTKELNKLSDIVINVSPHSPPYSLLGLQKLWANILQVEINPYIHSSVQSLTEEANIFMKNIQKTQNNGAPKIVIRLIWKEVEGNLELITSSGSNTVLGESNLARFLSRVGPESTNYEMTENSYEIDSVLDICYLLSRSKTKTNRQTLLQSLNSKLGKSQWLCNRMQMSVADLVASSIVKQTSTGEINVNLTKWMQRCQCF